MISAEKTSQLLVIPPLENGDRLTRYEFERRYRAMPHLKKAELIEGIVYVASPLRIKSHGEPHAYIMTWLGVYKAATPGVGLADNTTVIIDADNEPQPDALLRIEQGGRSRINQDDYLEGAPELIVEIAASTASYDLHEKLKVYRRNQVQEYLVWRVYDNQFDWFKLQAGEYIQLEVNTDNILRSQTFPGLWLAKSALLSGDLATVLAVLQQGLSTPEHQDFKKSQGKLSFS
ncbi:Uma2 family endonuclease [Nostoc parmelioides]|uniref:Uma2 family endonuclease n=1 Tax=Nostoc parmelioides FACHB-3921 TaxID=2692909 RepID=A0ABR8BHK5_9NOSO|nr:Uma2 family endonuclease [Nostoc parmelioides]MBD2253034.1 Uma2 family endonuclease [Nostoc parmelioides FACHB-3921]